MMIKVLVVTTVKISFDGLTNHILSYIGNMNKDGIQIDLVSARGIDENIWFGRTSFGTFFFSSLFYKKNTDGES